MTEPFLLLVLGGHLLLLLGTMALIYRLGRFVPTGRERRGWAIGAPLLLAWAVLLAFIGPFPLPIVLGVNVFAVGLMGWAWRTGRFSIEAVPMDVRAEVERRRRWMRGHVALLLALLAAYLVANLALAIGAVLLWR